jgi:hypothetical protein
MSGFGDRLAKYKGPSLVRELLNFHANSTHAIMFVVEIVESEFHPVDFPFLPRPTAKRSMRGFLAVGHAGNKAVDWS